MVTNSTVIDFFILVPFITKIILSLSAIVLIYLIINFIGRSFNIEDLLDDGEK